VLDSQSERRLRNQSHWPLVMRLTRQRIGSRYSASLLGVAWAFLLPLLMVSLLALVFGEILAVRWQVGDIEAYGAVLFSGLVIHLFVADCLSSAPSLVTSHAHYVKSTTFPLHILPWTMVLDAGFHLLAGRLSLVLSCRRRSFGCPLYCCRSCHWDLGLVGWLAPCRPTSEIWLS